MRPVTRLAVLVTMLAGAFSALAVNGPNAFADHCGDGEVETTVKGGLGHVCVVVTQPGQPGGTPTGEEHPPGGGPAECHDQAGHEIPCTDDYGGVWSAAHNCYAFPLDPQPPASNPMWGGHDPSEGLLYGCDYTIAHPDNTFFVPHDSAALVPPARLAERALGQLRLTRGEAHVSPPPSFHTLVGFENWLWIPAEQWRALSRSVTAGSTTVTVTAQPIRVEWDMGNGDVELCADPGRPWVPGMSANSKTACSYTYTDMEDPYADVWPVSAVIVYDVDWECVGACLAPSGTLGEVPAATGEPTRVEVRQRQVVVVQ